MVNIRAAADPVTRAALEVIVSTGLRIGGLPALQMRKDLSYYTESKGKRFGMRWLQKARGTSPSRSTTSRTAWRWTRGRCRVVLPNTFVYIYPTLGIRGQR